jgi:hypothetical protein
LLLPLLSSLPWSFLTFIEQSSSRGACIRWSSQNISQFIRNINTFMSVFRKIIIGSYLEPEKFISQNFSLR